MYRWFDRAERKAKLEALRTPTAALLLHIHTRHILPPSKLGLGLFWADFTDLDLERTPTSARITVIYNPPKYE